MGEIYRQNHYKMLQIYIIMSKLTEKKIIIIALKHTPQ